VALTSGVLETLIPRGFDQLWNDRQPQGGSAILLNVLKYPMKHPVDLTGVGNTELSRACDT
jgi:hypothetical protein